MKNCGIATSRTTICKLDKEMHAIAMEAMCRHPIPQQNGVFQVDESVFVKRKVRVVMMLSNYHCLMI